MSNEFQITPKMQSNIFPISELDRLVCLKKPNSLYASSIYLYLARLRFCREFEKSNKRLVDLIKKMI